MQGKREVDSQSGREARRQVVGNRHFALILSKFAENLNNSENFEKFIDNFQRH